ncbi:MAG: hypothetical protein LC747_00370, partial [Acidobacteria bacterium]|nr:hypothetical protein [Acidobacteriota bacterium]
MSIFSSNALQLRAALLPCLLLLVAFTPALLAQTPTTPPNTQDGRGLGLPNSPAKTTAAIAQAQTGETRPELVLQTGYTAFNYASTLHFSPDARLLATTAFNSNQVKLWEVATGRELRTLAISGGVGNILGLMSFSGVSTVAFSRDNRLLAAGGRDNMVTIWDLLTGRELQTFKTASSESITAGLGVLALVFNADGRQLISFGDGFRTWDVATGQQVRETAFDSLSAARSLGFGNANLAVSADGSQLALLTNSSPSNPKRVVKIYELASGREARTVKVSDDIETANEVVLSFTPDGRLLAAALDYGRGTRDNGAKLKLWDLTAKGNNARVLATLDGTGNSNSGLSFSADGRLLAVGAGQSVKVWDTGTGSERQTIKLPATSASFGLRDSLVGLAFSRDGKFMATSVLNAPLNIWETETGRAVQTLAGRSNYAYNVTFNADGTRLVSGSKTIWELDAGRGLRASTAGELFGTLTRDGRLLAATSLSDNKVTLYDAGKGQPLFTLAPTEKAIVAQPPVFSPDGRLIATTYRLSDEDMEAARKAATSPKAMKESMKGMETISKEMMKEMTKNPQAAMQKSMEALTQQQAQQQSAGQSSIEGQVKLWDTATGRVASTITVPSSQPLIPSTITAISFNADGRS